MEILEILDLENFGFLNFGGKMDYYSLNATILLGSQHMMLRPHAPGGTLDLGMVRAESDVVVTDL